MFKLLKIMAYGLLGYALYEFVRGAMGTEIKQAADKVADEVGPRLSRAASSLPSGSGSGSSGRRLEGGSRSGGSSASRPSASASTGSNALNPDLPQVATRDADGGSVKHRVGRGVR